MSMITTFASHWRELRGAREGLALMEFALSLPLVLGVGLYGIEVANLAFVNMRISQVALSIADNASRLGDVAALRTKQLSERDINDVFAATRLQGQSLELTTRGRITISSLEEQGGRQVLHWQRCLGLRQGAGYDSSYGVAGPNDGIDNTPANDGVPMPNGIGPADRRVMAPAGTGVIFVEVNYDYKPIVSALWTPARKVHYIASMLVRDRRDFSQMFNPAPGAQRMTCDRHTT